MIPDADKLKRYDDLANLVEELHDENMRLRGRARYPDIASLVAELRRQAAARNATRPCVLLSDLMPLCDELDASHDIMAECYGTIGTLVQERDRLLRGEFICQRCGLRKDSEHSTDHEF